MIDSSPQPDLREMLRQSIRLIKQKKPNLSSSSLALNLQISNSTFGRIENGEVRRPDFVHALAIIKAAHGDESAQEFANTYYPEVVANLKNLYKNTLDVPFVDCKDEQYFAGTATYELMMLATSRSGISRELVKAEYGNKGLSILDDLLAREVLTEVDGLIALNGRINATQPTVHRLAQNLLASNYNVHAFEECNNWLSLQYESVDKQKVLPLMREIMERASKEVRSLFNDPALQGDDVIWTTLTFDTLNSKEVIQ